MLQLSCIYCCFLKAESNGYHLQSYSGQLLTDTKDTKEEQWKESVFICVESTDMLGNSDQKLLLLSVPYRNFRPPKLQIYAEWFYVVKTYAYFAPM